MSEETSLETTELARAIKRRHELLETLVTAGQDQMRAIDDGLLTRLMQIISHRERAVNELTDLSRQIRRAVDDAVVPPVLSESIHRLHDQCNAMHLELLDLESACEHKLTASRDALRAQMEQIDNTAAAAGAYAPRPSRAGGLDLSN